MNKNVATRNTKEGKLEHKHLLYEGKQFCKQRRLYLYVEHRRHLISFWILHGVVFQDCVFSMDGNFSLLFANASTGDISDYPMLVNSLDC